MASPWEVIIVICETYKRLSVESDVVIRIIGKGPAYLDFGIMWYGRLSIDSRKNNFPNTKAIPLHRRCRSVPVV